MLRLSRYRPNVTSARRRFFFRRRTRVDSAMPVEAHVRIVPYVHVLVVNVVKAAAHVPNRRVVEEMPAFPTSPIEAVAEVAEAVVNPAVKTNRRPPIPAGKNKRAVVPAPPARRPQEAHFRRFYPRAGHPIIVGSIVVIIPVPRSPEVAVARGDWLLVNRYRRRPDSNRHADLRLQRSRHTHQ